MYPKNKSLDWINDEKSQIVSFLVTAQDVEFRKSVD
jgi:hypothetical protein